MTHITEMRALIAWCLLLSVLANAQQPYDVKLFYQEFYPPSSNPSAYLDVPYGWKVLNKHLFVFASCVCGAVVLDELMWCSGGIMPSFNLCDRYLEEERQL